MNPDKLLLIIFLLQYAAQKEVTMELLFQEADSFFPGEHNMPAVLSSEIRQQLGSLRERGLIVEQGDSYRIPEKNLNRVMRHRVEFEFKAGSALSRISRADESLRTALYDQGGFIGLCGETQRKWIGEQLSDMHSPVLDLGCGDGRQGELLQELSAARITGVDYSEDAVRRASGRLHGGAYLHDMEALESLDAEYRSIMSVDSLYFSRNPEDLLEKIREHSHSGERLLLYSEYRQTQSQTAPLTSPVDTILGSWMDRERIPYQAVDFSSKEQEIWSLRLKLLEGLKSQYYEEKTAYLYWSQYQEASVMARITSRNSFKRYGFRF